jgi:apolipoprotein N-acyltransferase
MWVAPVPVLLLATRLPRRTALIAAFLAWVIGGLNLWDYFRRLLETPLAFTFLIICLPALAFAAGVLLYRWLVRKSLWLGALVLPSFWVTVEFLNALTSPHSTAGNLGYTQMDFLPVVQIASITGIWSISFWLFLFAATLAILIGREGPMRERRHLAGAVAVGLIALLGFGVWRLSSGPHAAPMVTVGLLASDERPNLIAERPSDTLRLLREYAAQAESLAAQGATVIVIPEKIAVLTDPELPEADELLRATAAKTGALIVVGVIHPTNGAEWNEARLYFPDGSLQTYEKHHMLPAFEGKLTVGTTRTEWTETTGRLGVQICKDMDFPQLSREYGNDGTALVIVPAWDFVADGWWHGRMAILRGVESGFSIVRSPKQGVLTVTDNRGRVLGERTTGGAAFDSLVAAVPVQHEDTFYDRFGNWFGWMNLALFAALIATGVTTANRSHGS